MQLKRGDHIEQPLSNGGEIVGYFHHMLVLQPIDERRCNVLHSTLGSSTITEEEVDIFETDIINRVANCFTKRCKVSRVMYTECVDEDTRIRQLL